MMLGFTLYAIGWAFAHRHHSHVRVDIFYARMSPRGKAIIDVFGALLLFFPLTIVLAIAAVHWAQTAWLINEKMVWSSWYPPTAPIRIVLAIGLALLLLQGGAQFVRDLYILIRNRPYD